MFDGYVYIVNKECFRRARATFGFPLTLHRGTSLSSEKRGEESGNLHSGETSRVRSKTIGTSLGKSPVRLESYYARAHKARCWLFADSLCRWPAARRPNWRARRAPSNLDGAPSHLRRLTRHGKYDFIRLQQSFIHIVMLNKVQTLQARRPERTARVQCLLQSFGLPALTLFSLKKK